MHGWTFSFSPRRLRGAHDFLCLLILWHVAKLVSLHPCHRSTESPELSQQVTKALPECTQVNLIRHKGSLSSTKANGVGHGNNGRLSRGENWCDYYSCNNMPACSLSMTDTGSFLFTCLPSKAQSGREWLCLQFYSGPWNHKSQVEQMCTNTTPIYARANRCMYEQKRVEAFI